MIFAAPVTCLITDGMMSDHDYDLRVTALLELLSFAVAERVSLIQLREKQLCGRLLFELTKEVVSITKGTTTRLLVNDRADIAAAAGADGVHLATSSLPVGAVRRIFPRGTLIGVSTHDENELKAARDAGADIAVFGPVFSTPGKGNGVGSETLARACSSVRPFPVLALGGVNEENWRGVMEAGAAGFAAIRSLNDRDSLHRIMGSIKDEFR